MNNILLICVPVCFTLFVLYIKRYGNMNMILRFEVLKQLGMLNLKNLFSVQPIKILSAKNPERRPYNVIDEVEKFGHSVTITPVVLSLHSVHHGRYAIRCIHCKQFIFIDFWNDRAKKARKFLEAKAGSALYFKEWPIEDFPYKFLRKTH